MIGRWRGELGKTADMTLVWGVPLIPGGAIVTAELANLAVDQCELVDERFTLIAPDNYRSDYLEVKLWSKSGEELAAESLYVEDDDGGEDETSRTKPTTSSVVRPSVSERHRQPEPDLFLGQREVASDQVLAALGLERRVVGEQICLGLRAAGVEAAGGRRVGGTGDVACEQLALLLAAARVRNRHG